MLFQKPKHVASNKTDSNLVVTVGVYFLSAVHMSQRDGIDKVMNFFVIG
jgi:hypothetical protein